MEQKNVMHPLLCSTGLVLFFTVTAFGFDPVPAPHYAGKRYQAEVPDTLDLALRAELALNAVTRMIAPDKGYQMYAAGWFERKPPVLRIHFAEAECSGKHLEALPLLRMMSGSTFNLKVDKGFMESLLVRAEKDGCFYRSPTSANLRYGPPVSGQPFTDAKGEGAAHRRL